MTPNQTVDPTPVEPAPAPAATPSRQGPGSLIRSARERAALSLDDVAQSTKLARATLDALERDDFSTLNEAVYIRGYYRKVAKALNLPEQQVIAAYEGLVKPSAPPTPTKLLLGSGDNGPQRSRRRPGWTWLLVIALIALLLFAALRLVGRPPGAGSGLSEAPLDNGSAQPATAAADSATGAVAGTATALPSTSMSEAAAAPSAATAPDSAAPAPASSGLALTTATSMSQVSADDSGAASDAANGLLLEFKSASWVRVEDTYGKVLLSGMMQAGQHQALNGRKPLSVFLGNAHGVSASFQGKPVDFAGNIKDNATARFSVP